MQIKDKVLNKTEDYLSKYQTPRYDIISSCNIFGKVRGFLTTYDFSYIKEFKEKRVDNFISIDEVIDKEFENSEFNSINFYDNEKIICIRNHLKDTYIEKVYECFDSGYEKTYIECFSDKDYKAAKDFIKQNSNYVKYIEEVDKYDKEYFPKLLHYLSNDTDVDLEI